MRYFLCGLICLACAAANADADLDMRLYHAVAEQELSQVRDLIAQGAALNVEQRPWHLTPLLLAAERDPALARVLIEAGADINAADREHQTVLMKAVHKGNTEVVRLLLAQEGLDLEARAGLQANTALTYAVMWGRPDIVKLLIDAGADVNVVRVNGTTPLSLAKHMVKLALNMRHEGYYSATTKKVLDKPAPSAHSPDQNVHHAHEGHAHEHDDPHDERDLYKHKGHDTHGHRLRTREDAIREHSLVLSLIERAGASSSGRGDAPVQRHHH